MKQKYKEKCDICGKWTNNFDTSKGIIICDLCMNENKGKVELEEPVQTTIFDFIKEAAR